MFLRGCVFAGYRWSERLFYDKMAAVAGAIPGSKEVIMQTLKGASAKDLAKGKEILGRYGYYGRLPGEEPGLLFLRGAFWQQGLARQSCFFLFTDKKAGCESGRRI